LHACLPRWTPHRRCPALTARVRARTHTADLHRYRYRAIFEQAYPQASAVATVPGGRSIACSTERALQWSEVGLSAWLPGWSVAWSHQHAGCLRLRPALAPRPDAPVYTIAEQTLMLAAPKPRLTLLVPAFHPPHGRTSRAVPTAPVVPSRACMQRPTMVHGRPLTRRPASAPARVTASGESETAVHRQQQRRTTTSHAPKCPKSRSHAHC